MARYIYEWKGTEHGNRLFRRPGTPAPAPAKKAAKASAAEPAPLSSLKKDELIASAETRGLDSSGTKADIIERLEAHDDGQE